MHPITPENDMPDFEALAALGWSAFIMPRGSKIPAAGFSWKEFQNRKPTQAERERWAGSRSNVAIVTGRVSNLLILDVDSPEAQEYVDGLNLPPTPVAISSRGLHYYLKYPPREIPTKINFGKIHLDISGEGSYVLGPGSQHPDGTIYRWKVSPDVCPLAELPANVLDQLSPTRPGSSLATRDAAGHFIEAGTFSVWINREVQEGLLELRNAEKGERNKTLFRVAARLANHVAALGIDWGPIEESLRHEGIATGMTEAEVPSTLQSAWNTGSVTPTEWLQIARNWIYVASRDKFWSPATRLELSPRAFNMNFADVRPHAKVSLANFLTGGGLIERVLDFRFEPSKPLGVITIDNERFFNTYRAPQIQAEEGDWAPFAEFCEYLVPAAEERDHLLKIIAWTIANPGQKMAYALLLQSKIQGVGKSTLINVWRKLLGEENTRMTSSDEMDSGYQSYVADKLLVVLEEMNLGSGIGAYQRLKAMITEKTVVINEKHVKQREAANLANFVFCSNLDAPILIEQNDRRFFVIDTPAARRPDEYWTKLYEWLGANLGVVKAFFDSIDVQDFRPSAHPPMTPAKERLLRQSATPLAQALQELIEERPWPISRGICTIGEIRTALRAAGFVEKSDRRIASALAELGCAPLGQVRLSDQTRRSPWALFEVAKWKGALPSDVRNAFENPRALISRLGEVD